MRETIVVASCDVCWQADETKSPSVATWTVGIAPGEGKRPVPKVVEVCEDHRGMVEQLFELLDGCAVGEPEANSKPVTMSAKALVIPRKVNCPVCAEKTARSSLVGHIWNSHRKDQRPPIPDVCPECRAQYDNSQGMATHRRLTHQHSALQEALSGVKGYKITGKEDDL